MCAGAASHAPSGGRPLALAFLQRGRQETGKWGGAPWARTGAARGRSQGLLVPGPEIQHWLCTEGSGLGPQVFRGCALSGEESGHCWSPRHPWGTNLGQSESATPMLFSQRPCDLESARSWFRPICSSYQCPHPMFGCHGPGGGSLVQSGFKPGVLLNILQRPLLPACAPLPGVGNLQNLQYQVVKERLGVRSVQSLLCPEPSVHCAAWALHTSVP